MRAQPAAGPAGPPPAPALRLDVGHLAQYATGSDDTGGMLHLFRSDDGNPPWVEVTSVFWVAICDWTAEAAPPTGYYRGNEVGNGVAYVGTSAYSNTLYYEEV